jgi:hypothetical protein
MNTKEAAGDANASGGNTGYGARRHRCKIRAKAVDALPQQLRCGAGHSSRAERASRAIRFNQRPLRYRLSDIVAIEASARGVI